MFLIHLGLGQTEWAGISIVGGDERIDGLADLLWGGEGGALESRARQDGEPNLDLVEPACVAGREVEAEVGMVGEPGVALGIVDVEVVEDHVDVTAEIRRQRCGS